jgi:uncharacterized membrane protein
LDNDIIRNSFYEFGKKIRVIAIASVLSFIPPLAPVASIVALVFIFLALGVIRHVNYQLNNPNLGMFRSQYIRSMILIIIGFIFLVVGGVSLAIHFLIPLYIPPLNTVLFPISISILIVGLTLLISSAVIEMKAWENLKIYFQNNRELFPINIGQDAINGCDNLRTGALLYALGFLIITVFIGFIFQIAGYFKLAKLDSLMYYQVSSNQQIVVNAQTVSQENVQSSINIIEICNFCPNCGTKLINKEGKYCPLCGSQIN